MKALLCSVLVATFLAIISVSTAITDQTDRCGAAYKRGDFDAAIACCSDILARQPNNAAALAYRSNAYAARGDLDLAISDCTRVIELRPSDPPGYMVHGSLYLRKDSYDAAIADFTKVLSLQADATVSAGAFHNRGTAYAYKREYDRAIDDFSEAIRLEPADPGTYRNRANAFFDKADSDRAIADYTEVLRLKPQDAYSYMRRGDAYTTQGHYEKAIADYNEALRLRPADTSLLKKRADAYGKLTQRTASESVPVPGQKTVSAENGAISETLDEQLTRALDEYTRRLERAGLTMRANEISGQAATMRRAEEERKRGALSTYLGFMPDQTLREYANFFVPGASRPRRPK